MLTDTFAQEMQAKYKDSQTELNELLSSVEAI